MEFYLKIFLKYFFLSFFLVFAFLPFKVSANICLHPLEELALVHGKPKKKSLDEQIEALEDKKKEIGDEIDKLENGDRDMDGIEDVQTNLKNSLNENSFKSKFFKTDRKEGDIKNAIVRAIDEYTQIDRDTDEPYDNLKQIEGKGGASILPAWYKDSEDKEFFESNGNIDERGFCEKYVLHNTDHDHVEDCEEAIKDLEYLNEELSHQEALLDKVTDEWKDLKRTRRNSDADDEDTEAGALCWECLEELRELDGPTTGQVVGNVLSFALGGAMSYYGYKSGKREGIRVDDLRMRQGYDPMGHSNLSWAGAMSGLPFMANAVHGLAGGNSLFGNYACSPGYATGNAMYSPFGHHANTGFQTGAFGPHMNAHMSMNPYASMMNPAMNASLRFGPQNPFASMNPYASMMNPAMNASLQFGPQNPFASMNPYASMMNPAMNASLQFGPQNPFASMNPYASMMNPAMNASLQFGPQNPFASMNPYASMMNPAMNASLQFGPQNPYARMSPYAMNNPYASMMNPGVNQMQHQQQQYAQYMQFQQQQMQAQLEVQQAWVQHQQSILQDRIRREQQIASLTQDLVRIHQTIELVKTGGMGSSILGASNSSLSAGLTFGSNLSGASNSFTGTSMGPAHQPVSNTGGNTRGGGLPIIRSR